MTHTSSRVTAADVNARIDDEIMPALAEQTFLLGELKTKLDTFNGPTREAVVALAKVAHVLVELATDRSKQDELLAARALIRSQSRWHSWLKRAGLAVLWSIPLIVALGQIIGILPVVWRAFHR